MSYTYTLFKEHPEILRCLDDDGKPLRPDRWAVNNEIFSEHNDKIEQLQKENEELKRLSGGLIGGLKSINRRSNCEVPQSVTGDDEPCYWQRKEWIEYIFELCDNLESFCNNKRG